MATDFTVWEDAGPLDDSFPFGISTVYSVFHGDGWMPRMTLFEALQPFENVSFEGGNRLVATGQKLRLYSRDAI